MVLKLLQLALSALQLFAGVEVTQSQLVVLALEDFDLPEDLFEALLQLEECPLVGEDDVLFLLGCSNEVGFGLFEFLLEGAGLLRMGFCRLSENSQLLLFLGKILSERSKVWLY